jgi:hypothetical protein
MPIDENLLTTILRNDDTSLRAAVMLVDIPALFVDFDPRNPPGMPEPVDNVTGTSDTDIIRITINGNEVSMVSALNRTDDDIARESYANIVNATDPNNPSLIPHHLPAGLVVTGRDSTTIVATGGVTVDLGANGTFIVDGKLPPSIANFDPTQVVLNTSGRICVQGTNFFPASDPNGPTQLRINGVPLTTTFIDADTIIGTIPPSMSAAIVDIEVRNPDGLFHSLREFGYVASVQPGVTCRAGNVNVTAANDCIAEVLFVNGRTGRPNREVSVQRGTEIAVEMRNPPGLTSPPLGSFFALYAWCVRPSGTTCPLANNPTVQGDNIGTMCRPTPLSGGSPQPIKCFVSTGLPPVFRCTTDSPRNVRAPFAVRKTITNPSMFFIQGFIQDANNQSTMTDLSITNGILLRIE